MAPHFETVKVNIVPFLIQHDDSITNLSQTLNLQSLLQTSQSRIVG